MKKKSKINMIEVSIKELVPYAKNAKKHPPEQIQQIKASIQEFGFLQPLLIDKKNNIICGHGRVEAAKELGMETLPCIQVEHLTETQRRAFVHVENRLQESGGAGWDKDMLKIELEELTLELDFDLGPIGFSTEEIESLLGNVFEETTNTSKKLNGDPDDIPSNVDPICKPGDLWILGDHRLLCGDSTKDEHLTTLFNGERACFCFTSPPYSDMRDYNGEKDLSIENLSKFLKAPCDLFAVNLGIQRKNSEIVPYWDTYIKQAKEYGLKLLSWNVWDKDLAGSVANQTAMFSIIHEWIFVFGKETKKLHRIFKNDVEQNEKRRRYDPINLDGKSQRLVRQADGTTKYSNIGTSFSEKQMGTVVHVTPEMSREHDHPAMFPVELPSIHIISCTDDWDSVYEPFCGSGTTLIACEMTNRKCLEMELDPKYCDVIIARWEKLTGKKAQLSKE